MMYGCCINYAKNITEKSITLQIEIEELPTLNEVNINGIKKNKIQNILKETELDKGKKLSESFLTNTKNYIVNKFKTNVAMASGLGRIGASATAIVEWVYGEDAHPSVQCRLTHVKRWILRRTWQAG